MCIIAKKTKIFKITMFKTEKAESKEAVEGKESETGRKSDSKQP